MTDDPATLIDLVCRKSHAARGPGRREISVSAQESRGRRTAQGLGLTVRHVWREVGSASRFRRSRATPKQDLALAALEAGEIGALWVFRLDRWTRRGAGAILAIVEPPDGRPRRLLVDNGDPDNPGVSLDSANPRDRSELIRRAEDAREETEVLSQRVRNTKIFQRDAGEWLNGAAPYGLRIVLVTSLDEDGEEVQERKLEVDPDTSAGIPGEPDVTRSDIAREITYVLPVAGVAKRRIAARMNARGVPSPAGGSWAYSTVANMIGNPAYAGWQITGRAEGRSRRMLYRNGAGARVSVMAGEPLLSGAQYGEAQAAARGSGPPGDVQSWRAKHLLTDLLTCAGCGSSMPSRGRGYACWRPGAGGQCSAPAYVATLSAEGYVYRRWSARLAAAEPGDALLDAVGARWAALRDPETSAAASAARVALADAEAALSRLWRDRRAGLYDGPSEGFFAPELREANGAVVAAQQALGAAQGGAKADIGFLLDPVDQAEAWGAAGPELKRDLLRLAIKKIVVVKAQRQGEAFDGEKRMTITWTA